MIGIFGAEADTAIVPIARNANYEKVYLVRGVIGEVVERLQLKMPIRRIGIFSVPLHSRGLGTSIKDGIDGNALP